MLTEDFCWADYRIGRDQARGRACLFLDRDGVLIEDTGFPHRPDELVFMPETAALVAAANRAGLVVGIVSNQSGVARGIFGWSDFAAAQARIDAELASVGAHLDFVLACPHHPEAVDERYRSAAHPWRKPRPGMFQAAAERLELAVGSSAMVGDREGDINAAMAAGVPHRLLLQDADGTEPTAGTAFHRVTRATLLPAFQRLIAGQRPPA